MRLSLLYSATVAALAVGLSACAPVDTGANQCSDVNVGLVEVKDAKYISLPQNEGGLSPAKIAQIDALMQDYMAATPVDIAGCGIGIRGATRSLCCAATAWPTWPPIVPSPSRRRRRSARFPRP